MTRPDAPPGPSPPKNGKAPAVRGWPVCRLHGARGGAPFGARNGNYRHGARTRETIELIREANELARFAMANLSSELRR
jgi:uncharacterized membrane protein